MTTKYRIIVKTDEADIADTVSKLVASGISKFEVEKVEETTILYHSMMLNKLEENKQKQVAEPGPFQSPDDHVREERSKRGKYSKPKRLSDLSDEDIVAVIEEHPGSTARELAEILNVQYNVLTSRLFQIFYTGKATRRKEAKDKTGKLSVFKYYPMEMVQG